MSNVYSNDLAYQAITHVCNMYNTFSDIDYWSITGKISIKEGCISYTKYVGSRLLIELHEDASRKKKLFGKIYTASTVSVNSIYEDIYKETGIKIETE